MADVPTTDPLQNAFASVDAIKFVGDAVPLG
jgi:hypothetical protein